MMQYPWGKGTPKWVRDATANDSDKSFTVPAGKIWVLTSIYYELACTATVGNRSPRITITDESNVIFAGPGPAALTANQTGTGFLTTKLSAPGTTVGYNLVYSTLATPNSTVYSFLPELKLSSGSVVRVYDSAAIDPAADDLIVVLHYVEYDV